MIEPVQAERLARLIREQQPCVALTGAGISTESGIPDFRSPEGLWAEVDPMEVASMRAFRADPERVWRFYAARFDSLLSAEPNDGHLALATLERLGLLRAVITQNIDLLHERAGSRAVVEVHGSIRTATCPRCRVELRLEEVLRLIDAGAGVPHCPECGAVPKPDVVFFGELLPERASERAFELARGAGLLLVVGSSLEVHPVAALPDETLAAGGYVAVVNRERTALAGGRVVHFNASAGELLGRAAALLSNNGT